MTVPLTFQIMAYKHYILLCLCTRPKNVSKMGKKTLKSLADPGFSTYIIFVLHGIMIEYLEHKKLGRDINAKKSIFPARIAHC